MYLCEAAYNSDWHICGCTKYRRMLLLLMVRAQRPVYVAAGKFIPLSIETYTTVNRVNYQNVEKANSTYKFINFVTCNRTDSYENFYFKITWNILPLKRILFVEMKRTVK